MSTESLPVGTALRLEPRLTDLLRDQLRTVAGHTIAAVMDEVPEYAGALSGPMGANIENAVQMALAGFLRLASRGRTVDPGTPLSPALEGAYALGRGEARNGRSADALLSAYRVGARVAWRELSATAVSSGVPAATLASFAELVFAYIDELSAASVAGHADELASSDRARARDLQQLARSLVVGEPPDVLRAAAKQAGWTPPKTLTAVLLPPSQLRQVVAVLDSRTLHTGEELPGLPGDQGPPEALTALLVPEITDRARGALLRTLAARHAIVGPTCEWTDVAASYERTLRARTLPRGSAPLDTEEHLVELVLTADERARQDLRARALAPLAGLRPSTAERLTDTLRSWLLHQGRREEVAAALFVHPQTVRYRMTQLRDLYGDRLEDPAAVLELTVALGVQDGRRTH